MANIVRAEAQRLLDAMLGVAAYTAPTTPMKLALASATGSDTAAGTEVTGGSYARQTLAMGSAVAGSPSSSSNTGVVSYTNMPAVTVNGVDVYDNAGTPRRCLFGALATPKTTAAGDTLSFAVAAVVATLG